MTHNVSKNTLVPKATKYMKTVLIHSHTNINNDPRVSRQAHWLLGQYDIYTAGYASFKGNEKKHFQITEVGFSFLQKFLFFIFTFLKLNSVALNFYPKYLANKELFKAIPFSPDLIIINDLSTLPSVFSVFPNSKILFDAHEFYLGQFDNFKYNFIFKNFYYWLAKTYIPKLSAFMTVNDGISKLYSGIVGKESTVIFNAPNAIKLPLETAVQTPIQFVHHGAALKLRKIEIMCEIFAKLGDQFVLNLMLLPSEPEYDKYLRDTFARFKNIHFLEPVKLEEICSYLSQFDVGIFILPFTTKNYEYALPNKFFEFVHAGLAVVTGPSTEMLNIGIKNGFLFNTDSFEVDACVSKIRQLDASKVHSMKLAASTFRNQISADTEKEKFLRLVDSL